MSKLKDTSIGLGAMPQTLPTVPRVRPSTMDSATPRDGGGMSTGTTSGNYDPRSMSMLPNNSTPAGTQDVADLIAEEFQTPATGLM